MHVQTAEPTGYQLIENDIIEVGVTPIGLFIKTHNPFNRESVEHREQLRELCQHLMQYVETGSLVIEKASDMIVRTLETDHGFVTSEPVSINDVLGIRQNLIDNGCLTDFNGAPILQEMADKLPSTPKVIMYRGERRNIEPMEHPPDHKPDG